jgi:hypothetical protein
MTSESTMIGELRLDGAFRSASERFVERRYQCEAN